MAEGTMDRDVGKLWGEIQQLRTWVEGEIKLLQGNTELVRELRDGLRQLSDKLLELEKWGTETVNDLWHVKRPAECLGMGALETYKREVEKQMSDVVEKTELFAQIMDAIQKQKKDITIALIGFAGVIVTAGVTLAIAVIAKGG
jgi:hypothetical protein